jgi:hypothetical protein
MTQPMQAPMPPSLRQRRSKAARALATHARRGQLSWDDLAAWPDWAEWVEWADQTDGVANANGAAAVAALATVVGAVWHAAALRRCIHGATLKRLQQALGDDSLQLLCSANMAADGGEVATLPPADEVQAWLQAQGAEVMLAALPSPLLRLVLRERLWPQAVAPLPTPEVVAAARALQRAQQLQAALRLQPPSELHAGKDLRTARATA